MGANHQKTPNNKGINGRVAVAAAVIASCTAVATNLGGLESALASTYAKMPYFHDWKDEASAPVSDVAASDTEIKLPHLSGADPSGPVIGNQKYQHDVKVICSSAEPIVWQLPNRKLVLDDNPYIKVGWTSSSWVGADRGHDLERFDTEAMNAIGWTPNFYANNMCAENQHCSLSASDIQAHSQKLSMPNDECSNMSYVVNSSDTDVSVRIIGHADYRLKWTVVPMVSTYK